MLKNNNHLGDATLTFVWKRLRFLHCHGFHPKHPHSLASGPRAEAKLLPSHTLISVYWPGQRSVLPVLQLRTGRSGFVWSRCGTSTRGRNRRCDCCGSPGGPGWWWSWTPWRWCSDCLHSSLSEGEEDFGDSKEGWLFLAYSLFAKSSTFNCFLPPLCPCLWLCTMARSPLKEASS